MGKKMFSPLGSDMFGDPISPIRQSPVSRRFLVPPFSVLNAREGDWQERKRAWAAMGIRGEIGRAENLGRFSNTTSLGEKDTSIFDPVLCELIYRWFSPHGWQVIDPFAGGSVRGIVASCLCRAYWGGELRAEQVAANMEQAAAICPDDPPVYVCGDSAVTLESSPMADLLFSCPPYGDLEVYSDDPADLSNMEWHMFVAAYKSIIHRACNRLRPNRFACFVVGDFRDGKGYYRNFVGTTIAAFLEQGLQLYNEAVLVTAVGSASLRVGKQFASGRKFCKTHQNVLVFCKGDWKAAAHACGDIDIS